jgi:hypothetical protein
MTAIDLDDVRTILAIAILISIVADTALLAVDRRPRRCSAADAAAL